MTKKINRQALIDYITNNEVVYQKAYALIDVSNQNNPEQQNELSAIIHDCEEELTLDVRENMLGTPFEELAEWSNENDSLILIEDKVLMCIPNKDLNSVNI